MSKRSRYILITGLILIAIFISTGSHIQGWLYDSITQDMFVEKTSDSGFEVGPQVGARLPEVKVDFVGNTLTDASIFMGTVGLVLVLSRSYDWCPFCQKQALELQDNYHSYLDNGLNLVAMIHDQPEERDQFVQEKSLGFPVLSDIEATTVKALNVLNTEYGPDDDYYGLPYPGVIVVNPDGIVVGTLFLEKYSERPSSQTILKYALQQLKLNAPTAPTAPTVEGDISSPPSIPSDKVAPTIVDPEHSH